MDNYLTPQFAHQAARAWLFSDPHLFQVLLELSNIPRQLWKRNTKLCMQLLNFVLQVSLESQPSHHFENSIQPRVSAIKDNAVLAGFQKLAQKGDQNGASALIARHLLDQALDVDPLRFQNL